MSTRGLFLSTILAIAFTAAVPGVAQAQNVNKRLENQHDRIHQGVKDGQLTHNQVDRLKSNDARIRSQELRDKSRNDGRLTTGERKHLNRELNGNSRGIYRDRHDAAAHGG